MQMAIWSHSYIARHKQNLSFYYITETWYSRSFQLYRQRARTWIWNDLHGFTLALNNNHRLVYHSTWSKAPVTLGILIQITIATAYHSQFNQLWVPASNFHRHDEEWYRLSLLELCFKYCDRQGVACYLEPMWRSFHIHVLARCLYTMQMNLIIMFL